MFHKDVGYSYKAQMCKKVWLCTNLLSYAPVLIHGKVDGMKSVMKDE